MEGRGLVQDLMPNLTPSEREFIMTGMTDEDWAGMTEGLGAGEGDDNDGGSSRG